MKPAPPVTSAFPGRRDSAMAASLAPASVDGPERRRQPNGSTGRFRRTCGLSPHVLTVGAAESAPWRTPASIGCALLLRPLDRALELLLRHARAALDLQALRLVVELLLRPGRAAGGAPRRRRARAAPRAGARGRPRLRARLGLRPRPRLRAGGRAARPAGARGGPGARGRPAAPRLRPRGRATA